MILSDARLVHLGSKLRSVQVVVIAALCSSGALNWGTALLGTWCGRLIVICSVLICSSVWHSSGLRFVDRVWQHNVPEHPCHLLSCACGFILGPLSQSYRFLCIFSDFILINVCTAL